MRGMFMALFLAIGAGLLLRSFVRLQAVSPGFEPEGVISMRLGGTARQLANRDAVVAYYRPLSEALRSPIVLPSDAVMLVLSDWSSPEPTPR